MTKPRCKPFQPALRYAKKAVRSLHYDGSTLVIEIQGDGFAFARITFQDPIGFRVLDERDLCEFWDSYSEPNGWLYEVAEGGWLALEIQRPLFNSHSFIPRLLEYLIVDDKCISVLAKEPPTILDLGAEPKPSPAP